MDAFQAVRVLLSMQNGMGMLIISVHRQVGDDSDSGIEIRFGNKGFILMVGILRKGKTMAEKPFS